jgi:hypothetical protein
MTRDVLPPKQWRWNNLAAKASKEFEIDALVGTTMLRAKLSP